MTSDTRTAQVAYSALHREQIAPRLREIGFTGSSGTYLLPDDEWWRVVAFQKSWYSDRDSISFTVNLSLAAKDEWAAFGRGRRHPGSAASGVGYWVRLGNLMPPDGEDRWWDIGHDVVAGGIGANPLLAATAELDATENVARDVLDSLKRFGLPWLLGDPDPYRPAIGRGRRPVHLTFADAH